MSIVGRLQNFLLGNDIDDYDDYYDDNILYEEKPVVTPPPPPPPPTPVVRPAPARGTRENRIVSSDNNTRTPALVRDNVVEFSKKSVQIDKCSPQDIEEARVVVTNLKKEIITIVNLEGRNKEEGQRIIDFLSGSIFTLDGHIDKLSDTMFLVAPKGVNITSQDLTRELKDSGIDFGKTAVYRF